ncbi:hypothetical protein D3C73_1667960 [compost metagenome]
MSQWPEAADGLQKERVESVQQQGFVDEEHGEQAEARDPNHAGQRRPVDRERRAK